MLHHAQEKQLFRMDLPNADIWGQVSPRASAGSVTAESTGKVALTSVLRWGLSLFWKTQPYSARPSWAPSGSLLTMPWSCPLAGLRTFHPGAGERSRQDPSHSHTPPSSACLTTGWGASVSPILQRGHRRRGAGVTQPESHREPGIEPGSPDSQPCATPRCLRDAICCGTA